MILLIDNYDSFTYNLVQLLQVIGKEVVVFRNDIVEVGQLAGLRPSAVVISPGPGTPERAGICIEAVRYFGSTIPVLGVCLGHQSIAASFGGKVIRADRIMHGKTSRIHHRGQSIYRGLPDPFEATRYHSLIVDQQAVPECLEVSAWTDQGEIMGVRHRDYKVEGVQFHPESILTKCGRKLIENFIELCSGSRVSKG